MLVRLRIVTRQHFVCQGDALIVQQERVNSDEASPHAVRCSMKTVHTIAICKPCQYHMA